MRKICWNCPSYGWSDSRTVPGDEENLKACKQCKLAMYCSDECHQEHWKKVHKKHCRYLAGKDTSPIIRHDVLNCPKCKVEKASLKESPTAVHDASNPMYPCHIKHSFNLSSAGKEKEFMMQEIRHFAPIGELSGQFVSKHDQNISILQQIFLKIPAVYQVSDTNSLYGPISKGLAHLRVAVWYQSLFAHTEEEIDMNADVDIYNLRDHLLYPLMSNIVKYHKIMKECEINNDGVYKWWTTFIFFLNLFFQGNFFYRIMYDLQFIKEESFGMSEETLELKDYVYKSNFLEIWQKLLDVVMDKMVPFNDLLEIYCNGQLIHKCHQCSNHIKVATFSPGFLSTDLLGKDCPDHLSFGVAKVISSYEDGQNYVISGPKQYFSCGTEPCSSRTDWAVSRARLLIVSTGQTLKERFVINRCDSCYRVTETVHRCKCKIKVYCSQECRTVDRKVHKLCCEGLSKSDLHQNRKKKGNYVRREIVGKEMKKKFAKFCEEEGTPFWTVDKLTKLMSEEGFAAEYEEMDKALEDASNSNTLSEEVKIMTVMSLLMKEKRKV